MSRVLDIELQLKIRFVAVDLERFHGDDLGAVKSPDELIPADAKLAFPGFDLVVLHPPGLIGNGAVNPVALHRNRGGDVAHAVQWFRMKSRYNMEFCRELYCDNREYAVRGT